MTGDDDERQASPRAPEAGRAARRAVGASTGVTRRGTIRPLLRARRAQVSSSAGGHSRRAGSGIDRAVSGIPSPRGRVRPGRDHGRTPRRGHVPPRRRRRRPAAGGVDHRAGRRRHRGRARRRARRQGDPVRRLVRHLHRRGRRRPPPTAGCRDDPGLAGAVGRRRRRGARCDPTRPLGRNRLGDSGFGAEGAATGRQRRA